MEIIWDRNSATVRDVYEDLLGRRRIAYTTVMTVMKTLEKKGHLKVAQKDRAYVYSPSHPRRQVISGMVREFVERVFHGSAQPLLVHLVEDRKVSKKDIDEIARLLEKKK